jgi:integrase
VWLVRWRNHGDGANYLQAPLGTADDAISEGNLDFAAALRTARAFVEQLRRKAAAEANGPVPTVRSVVEAYMAVRNERESRRRGQPVRSHATRNLTRSVLGQPKRGEQHPAVAPARLADIALSDLTEADLTAWRNGLPSTQKAATKARTVNNLRAALNAAYAAHRRHLDPSFPAIVKYALKPEDVEDPDPIARENQILTDAQVARLISTARDLDADVFRLVVVLAATGARLSQVVRIRVGDVQREKGRIMVPPSRKGKGANKRTDIPVPVGKDVIDALQPAMTRRAAGELLLQKQTFRRTGIVWQRDGRGAWRHPTELSTHWKVIRERSGLPDVIPYALRHSSIVRGLRANLPIRLVAALHDTSVLQIERHYAKWVAEGLEELAARAVVPLIDQEAAIVPIRE